MEKLIDKKDSLEVQLNKLRAEELVLDEKIECLLRNGVTTDLKPEMQALHDYNEMKDLTQIVLGYLADSEQCTVLELHKRYNLPLNS